MKKKLKLIKRTKWGSLDKIGANATCWILTGTILSTLPLSIYGIIAIFEKKQETIFGLEFLIYIFGIMGIGLAMLFIIGLISKKLRKETWWEEE